MLHEQEFRSIILEYVEGACKSGELVVKITGWANRPGNAHLQNFSTDDLLNLIEKMVGEGEIVEVEYVLPTMPWLAKSFYLPKDVRLSVIYNSNDSFVMQPK